MANYVVMENKFKHLEFIQDVIKRMSSNSFLIKGWCVSVVSALFVLSNKESERLFLLITYISILIFCGLDAYYLSQEKKYRSLYNDVIKKENNDIDFSMDVRLYENQKNSWINCLINKTIIPIHLTLLVITVILMFAF